tara:strand:- start:395 stop:529 length:135 start_codon:yes stop_codon:yes gene_type:complete
MPLTQHLMDGVQTWLQQKRSAKLRQSYGREPKTIIENWLYEKTN